MSVDRVAGYMATQPELDRDSVDFQLAGVGVRGTKHSPYLDTQIKCIGEDDLAPARFGFPLPIKNYDDLRDAELSVPRILIVVIVPTHIDRWIDASESQMVLRHCAYWRSLYDEPATDNTTSITVEIDRVNVFNVDDLKDLMATVAAGATP